VAVREAVHEVLQGTGLPGSSAAVTAAGGAGSAGPGGPALMSAEQLAALDKMDTPAAAAAAAAAAGKESKKVSGLAWPHLHLDRSRSSRAVCRVYARAVYCAGPVSLIICS
jgi:hypothetical protein